MIRSRLTVATLLAATTMFAGGCGKSTPPPAAPKKATVTVVPAENRDLPDHRRYPGTTQAVESVTLVARVEGFLERRLFEEGTTVAADALMFVIEPAPYEAQVLQAQGAVREAEAQVADARVVVERNRPLVESGAVSSQEFDAQLANLAVAEGALESARATMLEAEIQLGYTEVRSPIAGRVGERFVDVGNLVGAIGGPSQLATVVSLDPIRVVFEPAGREAADFLAAWPATTVPVIATIPGTTSSIELHGTLDLVDNTAASGTSTVLARATFPNPDGRVLPGLAVDLLVELGTLRNRIVVPDEAIRLDPQHAYVWVVDDGKLARKTVELGAASNGLQAVTGIDAKTEVVVEGNPMMLRTGAAVDSKSESIDAFLSKSAATPSSSAEPAAAHPAQSPVGKSAVTDSAAASSHGGGGGS
jgi:RND family efflux transporter MFP subunit